MVGTTPTRRWSSTGEGPRFFFSSREEERVHVHVLGAEGEAKVWIYPKIEVARSHRLGDKTLGIALGIIREREDEIRRLTILS